MSTSKALQPFSFKGTNLRAFEINGEPWFSSHDTCDALGLAGHDQIILRLEGDEKGSHNGIPVISESGLYHIVLRANSLDALPFQRWVTREVLPSIRKTGAYVAPGVDLERALRMLLSAKDVLPSGYVATRVRQLLAQAAGEGPEFVYEETPLTVWDYLESRGLSEDVIAKVASPIGTIAARLYAARHGEGPKKGRRLMGNRMESVNLYIQAERPLLDEAYSRYMS